MTFAFWRRRTFDVEAVKWTGENVGRVRELVEKYCGPECGFRWEPGDEYNTIQWSCCEDHELEPNHWVVFLIEPEDEGFGGSFLSIISNTRFHRTFEEAK